MSMRCRAFVSVVIGALLTSLAVEVIAQCSNEAADLGYCSVGFITCETWNGEPCGVCESNAGAAGNYGPWYCEGSACNDCVEEQTASECYEWWWCDCTGLYCLDIDFPDGTRPRRKVITIPCCGCA